MKLFYFYRDAIDNIFRPVSRGFTLIEILVTLVIVSVVVLSLGGFTLSMVGSGQVSRERLVAVHLAEQVLEYWQHDTHDNVPTITTSGCSLMAATATPTYPVTVTCTSSSGGTFTIKSTEAQATGPLPANLLIFKPFTKQGYTNTPYTKLVTITWSHQGKPHSVYLTHLSEVK